MRDAADIKADYAALNELIVNCPDFERLESLLGGFNLFQVLKFEHGEIRHSNVLAWILDPSESHGLDATFLQKWLMRVIHEATRAVALPISAVDIDGWQLVDVEVRREWRNIDVLLILTFADDSQWIVCIENKIRSTQHSNQLKQYRLVVEQDFPQAKHQLFVLLSVDGEEPEDEAYFTASYTQVHRALSEAVDSRKHAIGSEPKVLLQNYLRLLEEKFMDQSEIAKTAQRIYQQHRRALDIIFEHRPDNLGTVSQRVQKLFVDNADKLSIIMETSNKSYLRFIPNEWDVPGNTHGAAWPNCNRTVICELAFSPRRVSAYVMSGKAPDKWIDPVWERSSKEPFRRSRWSARPKMWCGLHKIAEVSLRLDEDDNEEAGEVAQKIFEKCTTGLHSGDTQKVIAIIADELSKLHAIHRS